MFLYFKMRVKVIGYLRGHDGVKYSLTYLKLQCMLYTRCITF